MDNLAINKDNEYTFDKAYIKLLSGSGVITSKKSGYSYKAELINKSVRLKFFNPIISIWQASNYFSSEEILDKWYITE